MNRRELLKAVPVLALAPPLGGARKPLEVSPEDLAKDLGMPAALLDELHDEELAKRIMAERPTGLEYLLR